MYIYINKHTHIPLKLALERRELKLVGSKNSSWSRGTSSTLPLPLLFLFSCETDILEEGNGLVDEQMWSMLPSFPLFLLSRETPSPLLLLSSSKLPMRFRRDNWPVVGVSFPTSLPLVLVLFSCEFDSLWGDTRLDCVVTCSARSSFCCGGTGIKTKCVYVQSY